MNPKELPVYELQESLVRELRGGRRLLVKAPTGSGKSTQVPQMILDQVLPADREVVVLEPRRVAARLLARRVASERGDRVGHEVGYQVRFEKMAGPATRIRYVTEGILLRELALNPELPGVGAVVFDEFHERHIYGDVTLGHCLGLQETKRPDLAVIVMSATVETSQVEAFLKPCTVLVSEGRLHPVSVEYLNHPVDFDRQSVWKVATDVLLRQLQNGHTGDVLVFMSGVYEIYRTIDEFRKHAEFRNWEVLPLHGELPVEDQDRAVGEHSMPRIVVSTNVAESSVTIDGVRLVIDSGIARIPRYDPHRGINTLLLNRISQASAEQRAGRAGRTAPGRAIRLWTLREHGQRPPSEAPEVKRLDLAEVALTLKHLGIRTLDTFRWFEMPDPKALARAETLLHDLGATNRHGHITDIGRGMLAFPVYPRFSRMLIEADRLGCVAEAALVAALAQGRSIAVKRPGAAVKDKREDRIGPEMKSDFFLLMNAWKYLASRRFDIGVAREIGIHAASARQVRVLLEQFLAIAKHEGLQLNETEAPEEAVQKCILLGFSDHLALRKDEGTLRCHLVHGRSGELSRESVVRKSPLFVAAEVLELDKSRTGQRNLNVILSLATAIEEAWLQEYFPDDFQTRSETLYAADLKRVVTRRSRMFRDLVLESSIDTEVPAEVAAAVLACEVQAGRLPLPDWNESVERWVTRVNCLSSWRPDWEIPAITAEARQTILEQACLGARSAKELKGRKVMPAVKSWLTRAQVDMVERFMPERIDLPSGRKARVTYQEGFPPKLSATIQDLYGLEQAPSVAGGRVGLVIEILGPHRRPLQLTEDLASFWRETYPVLKRELSRRYPKHVWK